MNNYKVYTRAEIDNLIWQIDYLKNQLNLLQDENSFLKKVYFHLTGKDYEKSILQSIR